MQNTEMLRMQINHLVTQARHDIYTLSALNDKSVKPQILQRLWDTISSIHFLSELLATQTFSVYQVPPAKQPVSVPLATPTQIPPITPSPAQIIPQQQPAFTSQELAKYDGKNGRPAYVAVNGIVYDVTNNRGWAAATHFGLIAGNDYTREFASCHAGQQSFLAMLPVVGRLAS